MFIFFCDQFFSCFQIFCSKFIKRNICNIFFAVSSSVNFDHCRFFLNIQDKTDIIWSFDLKFVLADIHKSCIVCTKYNSGSGSFFDAERAFQYKHTKFFGCHVEFRSANPLCTVPCRNVSVHQPGLEPGRGLCLFPVLIPCFYCYIISCLCFQSFACISNSSGLIGIHHTTVPDICTAGCFSNQDLCLFLQSVLFFGFQFPGKYRFFCIQTKCFCDLVDSQVIYLIIFFAHSFCLDILIHDHL